MNAIILWSVLSLPFAMGLNVPHPPFPLPHPNITKLLPGPVGRKFGTVCNMKPFGVSGVEVPICKTFWQYSPYKPPIITTSIGRVDAETADRIQRVYGGIFKKEVQHSQSRGHAGHDGDMCCPTSRNLQQAPPLKVNSYGVERMVAQFESAGLYQYFHVGKCVESNEQIHCRGTCVQETSTVYLMVWEPNLASFEPFDVPAYCSCKNLGSADDPRVPSSQGINPPQNATPTPAPTVRPIYTGKTVPTGRPGTLGPIKVHYGKIIPSHMLTRPPRDPRPRYYVTPTDSPTQPRMNTTENPDTNRIWPSEKHNRATVVSDSTLVPLSNSTVRDNSTLTSNGTLT